VLGGYKIVSISIGSNYSPICYPSVIIIFKKFTCKYPVKNQNQIKSNAGYPSSIHG
jgi:hypothetical protein